MDVFLGFLVFLIICGIIYFLFQVAVVAIPIVLVIVAIYFLVTYIYKKVIEYQCNKYFNSEEFKALKKEHTDYINDFNELNTYIDSLKNISTNYKKTDYGTSVYTDNSIYNYSRENLKNILRSNHTYDCSLCVLNNARNQPFKYLCKYFNIEKNEENLKVFEDLLNKYCSVKEGKKILKAKKDKLLKLIDKEIPYVVKEHQMDRFVHSIGMTSINFSELYFPRFTFRYVSPGGNSKQCEDIILNNEQLEKFILYLSNEVKFRNSIQGQRYLMTKSLRDLIKKRDNYTCCECGNSIYKEENLLLEVDHIIPLSKGGMTTKENLQTLCWKCNRRKGSKIY